MAFTQITLLKNASDLVIGHKEFHLSNSDANVTPGSAAFPLGTVVHRVKNSLPTVAWTAVTADADVVDTNEFAVLFGDGYGFRYDFIPNAIATGKWNAIVIDRDAQFKEFYIKQNYATVLTTNYELLKRLLANQGLQILTDVSDYTVA